MTTIERIIALCRYYGVREPEIVRREPHYSLHHTLCLLDTAAGIETRGPHDKWIFAAGFVPVQPVGARVALLEEHMAREERLRAPTEEEVHLSDNFSAPGCCCSCHA